MFSTSAILDCKLLPDTEKSSVITDEVLKNDIKTIQNSNYYAFYQ